MKRETDANDKARPAPSSSPADTAKTPAPKPEGGEANTKKRGAPR